MKVVLRVGRCHSISSFGFLLSRLDKLVRLLRGCVRFGGLTEALLGLDSLRSCNAFTSKTSKSTYLGEATTTPLVAYNDSLTATILRESHSKTSA